MDEGSARRQVEDRPKWARRQDRFRDQLGCRCEPASGLLGLTTLSYAAHTCGRGRRPRDDRNSARACRHERYVRQTRPLATTRDGEGRGRHAAGRDSLVVSVCETVRSARCRNAGTQRRGRCSTRRSRTPEPDGARPAAARTTSAGARGLRRRIRAGCRRHSCVRTPWRFRIAGSGSCWRQRQTPRLWIAGQMSWGPPLRNSGVRGGDSCVLPNAPFGPNAPHIKACSCSCPARSCRTH